MNKPKTKGLMPNRFWMMAFPPYGIYYLFFKSRLKWYLKIPIVLIVLLMIILAVDLKTNPYRVENKIATDTITTYLDRHTDVNMGDFRKTERQGRFFLKKTPEIVYRTVTTKAVFDFILEPTEKGSFEVGGIFESYPAVQWRNKADKDKYPTAPMAMAYFYNHRDTLGTFKEATEDNSPNTLTTSKGTFTYTFSKDKVTTVKNADGKTVLSQSDTYDLPEKAQRYLKKHEETLGTLEAVSHYDLDAVKEMYGVKTSQGVYRIDAYFNGNLNLLKAEPQE